MIDQKVGKLSLGAEGEREVGGGRGSINSPPSYLV